MNEKAFRLDFFLALGALAMSIITTAALVYQTRVMHDSYSVALWPYLSVDTSYGFIDGNGIQVSVTNDGFGPAVIHSAQLTIDGKAVSGWRDYGHVLLDDPILKSLGKNGLKGESATASSIDGSSIVRSGETKTLLRVHTPFGVPQRLFNKHKLALAFCYCSLNGSCWTLHSQPGNSNRPSRPSPVSDCTSDSAISSEIY